MFRPHYGTCTHPNCKSPTGAPGSKGALIAVKKGWCDRCNYREKQAAKGDKAKKPYMAPLSDKRAKEQRLYLIANKLFLKHHPLCKMKIEGICHGASSQVHHQKGRVGELFLDQRFWMPCCDPCHRYCELHPEEAKEKGWSLERLKTE